jgi:hypothetical protein
MTSSGSAVSEGGEAAQVAEQHNHLAPMAVKQTTVAVRQDDLGDLRR